jgi:hypothetical protein
MQQTGIASIHGDPSAISGGSNALSSPSESAGAGSGCDVAGIVRACASTANLCDGAAPNAAAHVML